MSKSCIITLNIKRYENHYDRREVIMILSFSKEIYLKSVLLKAAFTFTDRSYIHLDAENDRYIVKIVPKNNDTEISYMEYCDRCGKRVGREIIVMKKAHQLQPLDYLVTK